VVVLPFADDSPARDQDYFCRGVAQEIIHALISVNVPVLMPGRDRAFRTVSDPSDSSKEKNAATIVAGSVGKSGNLYRISIRLTDRASGRVLWSETFDRTMVDVFPLQEEIARAVVETLSGKIAVQNDDADEAELSPTIKQSSPKA
jgi:TolB-like protein